MKTDTLPDDWTDEQTELFMRVYKFMIANKEAMRHPSGPVISDEHWQTVAHNAAFIAAELRDSEEVRIIDAETQQILAESPGRLNG